MPEYTKFSTKLEQAAEFWKTTNLQTWTHSDDFVACRLREFGLRHENPLHADILGVADYEQIKKLCGQFGRAKPTKVRDGVAIVYPFYDLPGRHTGFLIAQYDKNYELQQNFIPVADYRRQRAEAGYFLLHKLLKSNIPDFRGAQFASEDMYWALGAQIKYTNKFGGFLPLVASYSGHEAESYGLNWSAFHAAPRIFHATEPTPSLISRACAARGYASVCAPKQSSGVANLTTIRANTKTWQQALTAALLAENEIHAKSFATRLSVPHDKLNTFFQAFEHPFSAGFGEQVLAELRSGPGAPQDRWLVIEKEASWWSHVGRPIVNVRPQITKIIQADTGEQLYSGTITVEGGDVFTFTDSAIKIERAGLLAYSRAVLAPHNKLVIYDRLWNGRSLLYAMQMHPPEVVNVATRCGWDSYNKTFRFNRYEISETGRVVPTTPWPDTKNTITFDEPLLPAPLPIRALLSPAHENSYAWCLVAGVLSQLLAPVLNLEPASIALPTASFKTAKAVLGALCCTTQQATASNKAAARYFFKKLDTPKDWPALVFNAFSEQALSNIIPKYFNSALLVKLSADAGAVAPGYGWWTINDLPAATANTAVLRHVVPAYIQRCLKTQLRHIQPASHLYLNILSDLHAWLNDTYGASFNLAHAKNNVFGPQQAAEPVFRAIGRAIAHGKIVVLPAPRRRDQARNYIVKQPDRYWVNRHAVDMYFCAEKSPPPNWHTIIELLMSEGVYNGEQTIQNMSGIVVNDAWCDRFWRDTSARKQTEIG